MRFALSAKTMILFALMVALPLLALPVAARVMDFRLGQSPPADLTALPLQGAPPEAVALPMVVERISPADLADPADESERQRAGLDANSALPVAPQPTFDPLTFAGGSFGAPGDEVQIDQRTIDQLQRIRQRLEELGADYVIVETTDTGGRFRFHCRMNVEPRSPFTRPFEAISGDPVAAGEQVLREVEAWRLAAAEVRTRQE